MSLTIHVPTPDTPAKVRKAAIAPGRPSNRVAGGWIDDHVALKKMISLCPFCVPKFNPRGNHYELWRSVYTVAKCDDCNQHDLRCKSFIHQSTHDAVGDWSRSRRGRWAGGGRL